jgi:hypothetical protein
MLIKILKVWLKKCQKINALVSGPREIILDIACIVWRKPMSKLAGWAWAHNSGSSLPAGSPPSLLRRRSLPIAAHATSPMAADWSGARRAWEKWTGKHVGSSGTASPPLPSCFATPGLSCELIPILSQGCRSRRRCCSTTTPPGHLASSPSCKSHPRLREHGRLNGHLRGEILQCHGSCSVILSECRISSVTVWLSTATPVWCFNS